MIVTLWAVIRQGLGVKVNDDSPPPSAQVPTWNKMSHTNYSLKRGICQQLLGLCNLWCFTIRVSRMMIKIWLLSNKISDIWRAQVMLTSGFRACSVHDATNTEPRGTAAEHRPCAQFSRKLTELQRDRTLLRVKPSHMRSSSDLRCSYPNVNGKVLHCVDHYP